VEVGEGAAPAHCHPPTAQRIVFGDLAGAHVLLEVRPDVDRGLPVDDLLDQRAVAVVGVRRLRDSVEFDLR
jgi:hypothetical protein